MNDSKQLISAVVMQNMLETMSAEIIQANSHKPALIGIRTRGEFIAKRLHRLIESHLKTTVNLGILDVSFYRDDTRAKLKQPIVQSTEIPFDLTDQRIVLVDDVLFTGRSVRAAMDELMDFGRPARIELAVLVDRGHRELPIQADFIGQKVDCPLTSQIRVRLKECDDKDEVVIIAKP